MTICHSWVWMFVTPQCSSLKNHGINKWREWHPIVALREIMFPWVIPPKLQSPEPRPQQPWCCQQTADWSLGSNHPTSGRRCRCLGNTAPGIAGCFLRETESPRSPRSCRTRSILTNGCRKNRVFHTIIRMSRFMFLLFVCFWRSDGGVHTVLMVMFHNPVMSGTFP